MKKISDKNTVLERVANEIAKNHPGFEVFKRIINKDETYTASFEQMVAAWMWFQDGWNARHSQS